MKLNLGYHCFINQTNLMNVKGFFRQIDVISSFTLDHQFAANSSQLLVLEFASEAVEVDIYSASEIEVRRTIDFLISHKSAGPDGLSPSFS